MRQKIFTAIALLTLCLSALIITIHSGQAEQGMVGLPGFGSSTPNSESETPIQLPTITCALQPKDPPPKPALPPDIVPNQISLSRFRPSLGGSVPAGSTGLVEGTPKSIPNYAPKEEIALAHFTNYGERFLNDLYGKPANHDPIVVLHETVGSAQSAINYFKTPHYNDDDQVSYHALIRLNGTIAYLVPPDKRAFGAGNSVFQLGRNTESVRTNPNFPGSVNNFAYHISLETPPDGGNNGNRHSGYTQAQYQSLAWLVAKTGVPDTRLTTHKLVDRSGTRKDPRSFNLQKFSSFLQTYPRTAEIPIKCGMAKE